MLKQKRGQSILEYTLLITAVILAVVYGANVLIKQRAKEHLDTASALMTNANTALQNATAP